VDSIESFHPQTAHCSIVDVVKFFNFGHFVISRFAIFDKEFNFIADIISDNNTGFGIVGFVVSLGEEVEA